MAERRSRESRRRVRPEPVGAEAPTQHCPPAAAPHAVLTEEADHPGHVDRDDSPVLVPHNLAERRPSPSADEAFQEEVRHLAEEAARVARLEDQSPPATAPPLTSERQNPVPRRDVTPTSRPAPLRRGTRFQWLEGLPLDKDDPPPHSFFRCWKRGHQSAFCPAPKLWFHCFNSGRRRVAVHNCPRCATAYTLWEGRPAHEARFGPSATVTRPPQEPEMQPAPMEIERVRGQPNQSAAVSRPPSTPPPSATTGRQSEQGSSRSPTPPPPQRNKGPRRARAVPAQATWTATRAGQRGRRDHNATPTISSATAGAARRSTSHRATPGGIGLHLSSRSTTRNSRASTSPKSGPEDHTDRRLSRTTAQHHCCNRQQLGFVWRDHADSESGTADGSHDPRGP
ncbi:hypothetical protein QAD02_002752 [Eretmocerus hayati]|uniref:Uncharacterized protein n=1 Tax=Eretmocerus hayati TaxID=131215 RepID=A0ACC2NL15_9HYME|nr:hypothetical protein QAD02_002752 [Eretmocerus hayati]